MKQAEVAALTISLSLKRKSLKKTKKPLIRTYCLILNQLQKTYKIDDVTAEAEKDKLQFTQTTNSSPLQLTNAPWSKMLFVWKVHNWNVLKGELIYKTIPCCRKNKTNKKSINPQQTQQHKGMNHMDTSRSWQLTHVQLDELDKTTIVYSVVIPMPQERHQLCYIPFESFQSIIHNTVDFGYSRDIRQQHTWWFQNVHGRNTSFHARKIWRRCQYYRRHITHCTKLITTLSYHQARHWQQHRRSQEHFRMDLEAYDWRQRRDHPLHKN